MLVPLAAVVTPNLAEAAALVGYAVDDVAAMTQAGRDLVALGARAAILKGGHLVGDAVDVLVTARGVEVLRARRVAVAAPHGTGCTFAAALTAELARGASIDVAARAAKRHTLRRIRGARRLGRGHPVLGR
jgi:hydroxymethylpyrimidine kinase/phosphomethylpyrimidine kinase